VRTALLVAILLGAVAVPECSSTQHTKSTAVPSNTINVTPAESAPVLRGTINVVMANDNGIVVLTDSMITEEWRDADGNLHARQKSDPGQKLFRLDDQTVCAFAGFASAQTPPLPDFINSVSGIIGRYQGYRERKSLSFSDKLQLLEGIFSYYLAGVANLQNATATADYYFELFLAGFDVNGMPEVGSVILGLAPEQLSTGQLLRAETLERRIFPITSKDMILGHGKTTVAMQILNDPKKWAADPAIAAYEDATEQQHHPLNTRSDESTGRFPQTAYLRG
jgi:hypothetical protein